jgi:predicted ATPase
VDLAGAGYCFDGAGGAGKSTLASALSASSEVTILGEDQVVLRYLDGQFSICGTPWHLNPAMCSPRAVPLEKLFFLERAGVDAVAPCSPLDGVTRLLQTALIPYYRPDVMPAILDRLAILAERVQFYTLSYRLGTDILRLIRGV